MHTRTRSPAPTWLPVGACLDLRALGSKAGGESLITTALPVGIDVSGIFQFSDSEKRAGLAAGRGWGFPLVGFIVARLPTPAQLVAKY